MTDSQPAKVYASEGLWWWGLTRELCVVARQEAEAAGCTVVSGLEMFVGQAVEQYELFTKQAAPVTVMRQAVMESLVRH